MCLDTKTSSARNPVVDDLHWAACCRLVCVEGYTTTAMYVTSRQEDPALFPWVLLLLLGLTVASFNGDPTCHDVTPDQLRSHPRQLQKLGETLDHMCNDWSSWTNLLPDSCFDISAQQYILMQLLDCITCSSKVSACMLTLLLICEGACALTRHCSTTVVASCSWCKSRRLTHLPRCARLDVSIPASI